MLYRFRINQSSVRPTLYHLFSVRNLLTPETRVMSKTCCALCGDIASVYTSNGLRCLRCIRSKLAGDFRKALGRAGASGANAQLAIAVSGGWNSCALAALASEYLHSIQRPPGVLPPRLLLLHTSAGDEALKCVETLADTLPSTDLALVAVKMPEVTMKDRDDCNYLRITARNDALVTAAKSTRRTLLWGVSATREAARIIYAILCGRPVPPPLFGLSPLCDIPSRLLVRYSRDFFGAKFQFFSNSKAIGPIAEVVDRFIGVQEVTNHNQIHNIVRTCRKLLHDVGIPCILCGTATENRLALCCGCELIANRTIAYEKKKQLDAAFQDMVNSKIVDNNDRRPM